VGVIRALRLWRVAMLAGKGIERPDWRSVRDVMRPSRVNRSELPVREFVLLAFVAHLIAPPVRDLFEGLGSICKNGDLVRYRLIAPDDNVDVEWVEFNAAAYPPCILGSN
jgi:hypothetical protein